MGGLCPDERPTSALLKETRTLLLHATFKLAQQRFSWHRKITLNLGMHTTNSIALSCSMPGCSCRTAHGASKPTTLDKIENFRDQVRFGLISRGVSSAPTLRNGIARGPRCNSEGLWFCMATPPVAPSRICGSEVQVPWRHGQDVASVDSLVWPMR